MIPPEPLYLPFEPGPYRMVMGLVGCDPAELIQIDEHYTAQIAERRALVADFGPEAVAAEPGAQPECAELLTHLAAYLPRRYPAWFERRGGTLHNHLTGEAWPLDTDPLRAAALLVQEDLCLLRLRGANPVLVAGAVCFPSGWRLPDKLGRPLPDVHGPVPLYADRLAGKVDRFMNHLAPGKLVERFNWGLHDDPALFRRPSHAAGALRPEDAANALFLRVERQTLSRLEQTGAILFTIRTHVYPLQRVVAAPGAAALLANAVCTMPPEMRRYKGIESLAEPLLAYLRSVTPEAASVLAAAR